MVARLTIPALLTVLAVPAGAQDRVLVLADPADEALLSALRIELLPAGMTVVPGEPPGGPTERARLEEVRLRAAEHEAVAAVWIEPIDQAVRVRVLWIGRGVTEAAVDSEARGRVLALVAASLIDEVRSSDVMDLVVPATPPRALADPAAAPPPPRVARPAREEPPPPPHSVLPRVGPFLQAIGGAGFATGGLTYRAAAAVGVAIDPGLRFALAGVITGSPWHSNGDVAAWPRSYMGGLEVSFRPDVRPFAFQLGFQARIGYGEFQRDPASALEGRFAHAIGLHLAAGVVLTEAFDLLVRFDGEVHGLQEIATGGLGSLSIVLEVH